jgi:hypothetical protein
MQAKANDSTRFSIWDMLGLLKQVPASVYIFPLVTTAAVYVILGAAVWLLVTPLWKELAGEWDVVGKYVAILAWGLSFPIVFNLLLSLILGIAFDPLATKIDTLLHGDDHRQTPIRQQWSDSIARMTSLLFLQAVAIVIAAMIPVLGLIVSGVASVLSALVLITTPAVVHRGISFPAHVKLIRSHLGIREVLIGILAAILLNNPLLQVITLVPLVVVGQLMSRSWIVD